MSLEAFIWVSNLPLDVVGPTPYRVLVKLANHAHSDGRNAWRSPKSLAEELHCSRRTIERAFKELRNAHLITAGDQRILDHIRADHRPMVYDLNFDYARPFTEPAVLVPRPDETDGSHGPSDLSRPDNSDAHGPTTGVAQGTVFKPINSSSGSNYRGAVAACGHPLIPATRYCTWGCRPAEASA